jgi:hypothetical protein
VFEFLSVRVFELALLLRWDLHLMPAAISFVKS